jgi:hypothetical protein
MKLLENRAGDYRVPAFAGTDWVVALQSNNCRNPEQPLAASGLSFPGRTAAGVAAQPQFFL